MLSLCLAIQRSMRVTHLGLFLRVIVNEKPLNLEKTTSSIQSVLLIIYGYKYDSKYHKVSSVLRFPKCDRPFYVFRICLIFPKLFLKHCYIYFNNFYFIYLKLLTSCIQYQNIQKGNIKLKNM